MSYYHRGIDPIEQYRKRELASQRTRTSRDLWQKARVGILQDRRQVQFFGGNYSREQNAVRQCNTQMSVAVTHISASRKTHSADLWRKARIGVGILKKKAQIHSDCHNTRREGWE